MTPQDLQQQNEALIRAYRVVFGSADGQIVMADLMRFCKFRIPIDSEVDEGKRQAFLRIVAFSALDDEQLMALYGGRRIVKAGGEE